MDNEYLVTGLECILEHHHKKRYLSRHMLCMWRLLLSHNVALLLSRQMFFCQFGPCIGSQNRFSAEVAIVGKNSVTQGSKITMFFTVLRARKDDLLSFLVSDHAKLEIFVRRYSSL